MGYGSAPYQESSLKSALRIAAAGLGSVPRGANFGTAFAAAAGGASKAYGAAEQAAQEYAQKQQQAQEESDFRDYQKMHLAAQTKALEKPPPEPKVPGKQQDYEHLILLGRTPDEARAIVYGLTPAEQITQKKSERPPKATPDAADTSWIPPLVTTMRNGQKFIDTGQLQGKEKGAAIKWASANGVMPLGTADTDALNNIENTRGNMDDIEKQLTGLLPKDAAGRVLAYPGNRLSRFFQTSAQRAAFGSFRAAAIQSLRSMAGSKGLRINQAEIKAAMHNDIPQINDTYATALQRLKNVRGMLDRAEHPITSRNWGTGGAAQPTDADNAYLKKLGY